MRAFREQVGAELLAVQACRASSTRSRSNVEVGEGGHKLQRQAGATTTRSSRTALPGGHFFQDKIENVVCGHGCQASHDDDPEGGAARSRTRTSQSSKAANAAALGQKVKTKAPPPSSVTVTVLNGNGVAGVGGERVVPARPARLQGAAAAEQPRAERADAGLLPHADLLRPSADAGEGGRDSRCRS